MPVPLFRFTLTHNSRNIDFDNYDFASSISGWSQINSGSDATFSFSAPSYARANAASPNTSAIGQSRSDSSLGWHPGKYIIDITAINTSTGGSSPLASSLSVFTSNNGTTLGASISYSGVASWSVGAGTSTNRISFVLDNYTQYLFFKFIKQGSGTGYNVNIAVDSFDIIQAPTAHPISEPDGWKESKLKMERHNDFHSLVEYFDGTFIFYGNNGVDDGGIEFIKEVESEDSFDSKIDIKAEATFDSVSYETIFEGQLDLSAAEELLYNKISIPIIRNDFWAKFIARKETPVNIRSLTDLDGGTQTVIDLVDVNLTAQRVRQKFEGYHDEFVTHTYIIPDNQYGQIDFSREVLSEIKEKFNYPLVENSQRPFELFAVEYAGTYVINVQVYTTTAVLLGSSTDANLQVRLQINDDTATVLTRTNEGSNGIDGRTRHNYSGTLTLDKNDFIRLYFFNNNAAGASYQFDLPANIFYQSYLFITADTVHPSSEAQAYLIHDAGNSIADRIIGRSNTFYSEFFGSTVTNGRVYADDGCAWKNILINGLQIRGYTFDEKQMSLSFDKWWKGVNPIFNLGLGYDTINDEEVIRVENKAYFYDNSDTSLNISNAKITRQYDVSRIFNRIEVGFTKWQSEDISGIDDVQTKRTYATRVEKINNPLQIQTDFIAASIAIEITRRKTIEKNADYKYDDDTFIISINGDDVSPDRYRPEINENFTSITGLLNSDTRYNSIHTPLRMMLRWGNYWNGCLQKYQQSKIKFVSGEGNYDMISDYLCASGDECLAIVCDPISEKQDIPLGSPGNYGTIFDYLHLPILYKIEVINFSWDDYLAIRNDRRKAIGVSEGSGNFKRMFIKQLEYELCNSKATIQAWAFDELILGVQESEQPTGDCPPPPFVFDADYQAVIDYASAQGYTLPSYTQQLLQNQLVINLKSLGIWSSLDLLYVFASDAGRSFAKINWKNPSVFYCSEGNTPTFTNNIGFDFNGTNSYLDTGWIASVNGVNYTLNNSSVFLYVNNELTGNSSVNETGVDVNVTIGGMLLTVKNSSNQHFFRINSLGGGPVGSSVSSIGLFQVQRTASNAARIFKNGSQVGSTSTQASTALPTTRTFPIGGARGSGGVTAFSDAQVGFYGLGASLSGKENDLYAQWNNYFTSL